MYAQTPEIFLELLVKDNRVDMVKSNGFDRTPLWCTAYFGLKKTIQIFITSGRYLNQKQITNNESYPLVNIMQ